MHSQIFGSKNNFCFRNVKCLSCDADVATKTEVDPGDYPRSPTLPPTKTIAPYLAYELDVMRKQQRG